MYQVKIYDNLQYENGTEIHSPRVNELKIKSNSLRIGINVISGFRFTIYPNNPGFNKINPLKTIVTVYDTKARKYIFEGRVFEPDDRMKRDGVVGTTYQCGDFKSFLQDSLQSWAYINNMAPKEFLQYLLDVHNPRVEPYKRFLIGEVTVKDLPDNVYFFLDDTATTYDMIKDRVLDRLGGELKVRNVNGQLYLDWVDMIGEISDTTIQLQKNMISISKVTDVTGVITRLFPRGARIEDENDYDEDAPGAVSLPRVTIASVNDGVEYIDASQDMIDQFGLRSGPLTLDDTTLPENLLASGKEWLANQKAGVIKAEVTAVDLGLIGLDPNRFVVGTDYRCVNKILGLDMYLRIVEMSIDINRPEESLLALGDKKLTLSQIQSVMRREQRKIFDLESNISFQGKRISHTNRIAQQALATVNEIEIPDVSGFITETEVNEKINEATSDFVTEPRVNEIVTEKLEGLEVEDVTEIVNELNNNVGRKLVSDVEALSLHSTTKEISSIEYLNAYDMYDILKSLENI